MAIATGFLFACTAPTRIVVREGNNNRPRQQPQPPVEQYNPQPAQPPVQEETTYQVFYDELSPYGNWVDYPGYGYVWSPNVQDDFQPYSTNGHWVYSEGSWTWVSNYQWGWAAFHYGRWFYEDRYGWLWIPGNEWAPAWVTWGQSGDYYGWAALGPKVRANDRWTPPSNNWNFVPRRQVNNSNVNQYVVSKTNNTTIVKNVTVINNVNTVTNNNNTTVVNNNSNNTTVNNNNTTVNNNKTVNKNKTVNNNINVRGNNNVVYNKGPQVNEVEQVTNTKVEQVDVNDDNKPGQAKVKNRKLVIYRPVLKDDAQATKKPAPKNVGQLKARVRNPANN